MPDNETYGTISVCSPLMAAALTALLHRDLPTENTMSTRAFLYADPGKNQKELAESATCVPLVWIALLSSEDVANAAEKGCFVVDRKTAIARCAAAAAFLEAVFPKVATLKECVADLIELLEKCRAASIGIDLLDRCAMGPETFVLTLKVAVESIEDQDEKRSLTLPSQTVENPFTRKPMKVEAKILKNTRAVLCSATGFDPSERDPESQREQLVGYWFKKRRK